MVMFRGCFLVAARLLYTSAKIKTTALYAGKIRILICGTRGKYMPTMGYVTRPTYLVL